MRTKIFRSIWLVLVSALLISYALIVGLLYKMCRVQLVLKQGDGELNKVNHDAINDIIGDVNIFLNDISDH